jgi:hypothetical protein
VALEDRNFCDVETVQATSLKPRNI